ncbi:HTH-10 family transcription regulator [Natronomonas pharaonis DSM 2160]|uniref:HTH-10 family transcription regulator n=1 Tax=Natronomonas pharaonis (strain ATCC 35678 / DSM 2160 / CIP 103997 / JCM 8858 / NBRC 14720 / NCIMB 2260 / Gabara) TaxID=348780 RepID=A0A1U7EV31_NATPD|nr:helix-turn-helix domain-containing protein [Natronomonas pharaonis]CAI48857.1 HTH-10 family transcription regulator [Natronomonas pharaonis DSM 2160]
MTLARIRVDLPGDAWVSTVSRSFPDATFRLLATMPGADHGEAVVSVEADRPEAVLDAMADCDPDHEPSPVSQTDRGLTVQLDTAQPEPLRAASESGLPVEPPCRIQNGTATVDLRGSHDRLSAFGQQLDAAGLDYEVEFVGGFEDGADRLLTDTQRELLMTAIDLGYYDTPRGCTLTELAAHLDIAKSTCSETLQRAEGNLIKQFAREHFSAPAQPASD